MSYEQEIRKLVGSRPLLAVGVAVLVADSQGRLLFLKRSDTGKWTVPGGYMEPNERPEETARRELKEEIKVEVDGLELWGAFGGPELFHVFPNGDQVHNVTIVYLAHGIKGEPQVDQKEVTEARWEDPTTLDLDLMGPVRPLIDQYNRCKTT